MARQKTRQQIAAEYNTTVDPIKPGQSEVDYFKQLAKRADQRMVRLERLAEQENYRGVLSYAYQTAVYDIKTLSGDPNATRFNIALKKNKDGTVNQQLLHAKINAVTRFLEAPTSMKKTITESYQKRADTINRKFGTNFTWQQMGRFFESAAYEKMRGKSFASDTILKAFGSIKKAFGAKKVTEAQIQNVRVSDDNVVNEVSGAIVKAGLKTSDFLK